MLLFRSEKAIDRFVLKTRGVELKMSELVYIPFDKKLYQDLVRFSDGRIDPAELAEFKVRSWIDMNFSLGVDGDWLDDSFETLFGDGLVKLAEEYAPYWLEALSKRQNAEVEAFIESRRPLVWKEVTVPAGSEVRMLYKGAQHYAVVKNGYILDGDGEFSPSAWAAKVTSSARNAWRDLWFKEPGSKDWIPAEMLRQRARRALERGKEKDNA